MINRFSIATAIALACLSPAAVAETKQSSSQPIKIGFITALTGAGAESGKDMVNGIKLYMDQVHSRMAGRPVELIIENDGGDPATSLTKLLKLIQEDKVQMVDGILGANIGYKIAPFVDKYKIPTIFPVTSGDDLTKRQHHEWIVRTSWAASQPTQPFGEWVYNKLHYKRVIIFGTDFPLGWECAGGFQRTFEEAGGKVVQKIWAPLGISDLSTPLKSMRKDADAVFFATALKSAIVAPKQYQEFGPKLPIIGTGTAFDEAVLRTLGDEALGAITAGQYAPTIDNVANKRFVAAYQAKYHQAPSIPAEHAYVSGMWINKALESLQGDVSDPAKLLAALKQVQLTDAPRGPIRLDSYGNPIENIYVFKVTKANGKLQNSVIDTFKDVSQFWKYDPIKFMSDPPYSREFPPCKFCGK